MKILFCEKISAENTHENEKLKKEENTIKKRFKMLFFVFVAATVISILFISQMKIKFSNETEISNDYVSVFKESEIHKILFDLNENEQN